MRIAVLGAGGHLGASFCHHLVSRHSVTAVTRPGKEYPSITGLKLDSVEADLDHIEFDDLAKDHDCIVDAASPYPLSLNSSYSVIEQAEKRTMKILGAVERSGTSYVYLSSFVTLPRRSSTFEGISSKLTSKSHPYYVVKHQLERMVLQAQRSNDNIYIFNPSACFGPWDVRPPEHCIIPQLAKGNIPIAAEKLINIVDVRDVASFVIESINRAKGTGRTPVFGHDVKVSELVRLVCSLANRRPPPSLPIPGVLSNLALVGAEVGAALIGKPLPVPALPVLLMNESYDLVDKEVINCRSFEDTIRDAYSWYRSAGQI